MKAGESARRTGDEGLANYELPNAAHTVGRSRAGSRKGGTRHGG